MVLGSLESCSGSWPPPRVGWPLHTLKTCPAKATKAGGTWKGSTVRLPHVPFPSCMLVASKVHLLRVRNLSSCGNGFDHDHPCGTDGGAQGGASPQIPQPESRSARNEEFPSPAGRLFPPHGLLQGLREARTRTESSVSPNPRSCLRPC